MAAYTLASGSIHHIVGVTIIRIVLTKEQDFRADIRDQLLPISDFPVAIRRVDVRRGEHVRRVWWHVKGELREEKRVDVEEHSNADLDYFTYNVVHKSSNPSGDLRSYIVQPVTIRVL